MTRTGLALGAACTWLAARPDLQANPALLLRVTATMVQLFRPQSVQDCQELGIAAVREVAMPTPRATVKHLFNGHLLNPEDLCD